VSYSRRHPQEAFERFVDFGPDCWLWKGAKHSMGYGKFNLTATQQVFAHRMAWELWNGRSIPPGLVIRHTCDTPLCVNPMHLLLGTRADNSRDMVERGRSTRKATCLRGHDRTALGALTDKGACRKCMYLLQKQRASRLRSQAAAAV
jgi:hypothetical protein